MVVNFIKMASGYYEHFPSNLHVREYGDGYVPNNAVVNGNGSNSSSHSTSHYVVTSYTTSTTSASPSSCMYNSPPGIFQPLLGQNLTPNSNSASPSGHYNKHTHHTNTIHHHSSHKAAHQSDLTPAFNGPPELCKYSTPGYDYPIPHNSQPTKPANYITQSSTNSLNSDGISHAQTLTNGNCNQSPIITNGISHTQSPINGYSLSHLMTSFTTSTSALLHLGDLETNPTATTTEQNTTMNTAPNNMNTAPNNTSIATNDGIITNSNSIRTSNNNNNDVIYNGTNDNSCINIGNDRNVSFSSNNNSYSAIPNTSSDSSTRIDTTSTVNTQYNEPASSIDTLNGNAYNETPTNNPYCMYGTGNNIMTSWKSDVGNSTHSETLSSGTDMNRVPNPHPNTNTNTTDNSNGSYKPNTLNHLPQIREYFGKSGGARRNLKNMTPNSSASVTNHFAINGSLNPPINEHTMGQNGYHFNSHCQNTNHYNSQTPGDYGVGDENKNIDSNIEKTAYLMKQNCNKISRSSSKLSRYYASLVKKENKSCSENIGELKNQKGHQIPCDDQIHELNYLNAELNRVGDNGTLCDKDTEEETGISTPAAAAAPVPSSKTSSFVGVPIMYTKAVENSWLSDQKAARKDDKKMEHIISSLSVLCCKCHQWKQTPETPTTSKNNDTETSCDKQSEFLDLNKNIETDHFSCSRFEDVEGKENGLLSCDKNVQKLSRKRNRKIQEEGEEEDKEEETEDDSKYQLRGIVMETCDDVILVKYDVEGTQDKEDDSSRHLCLGCQKPVSDRYVLHVRDHGYWHADCLKCSNCQDNLSTHKSCYVKNEQVFCRNDYNILFGQSCVKCSLQFKKEQDWMRIAGDNRYHIACFLCKICKRQLGNNEKYHLVNGTDIYCTNHYRDMVSGDSSEEGQQPAKKAKRNRTSYTENQIKFLQERFLHDSNPDGNELEKIANHISLKKRVVQVWFQNNRARLKKTANNGKGGNQDISGTANCKGRVATPGSLSDSALTMDWDNSLDPATLDDQGYVSPNTSTTSTTSSSSSAPTHLHQQHQQQHQHHLHPLQQQISPGSTPQHHHYHDLFGLSANGGSGVSVGSSLTSQLQHPLTPGDHGHHPNDLNNTLGGEGVCANDQQVSSEFQEVGPLPFTGSDNAMTLTSNAHSATTSGETINGDNNSKNNKCDENPHYPSNTDNVLSRTTNEDNNITPITDGLTFDPEKLNSLRNSFASDKYLDSFRRMESRDMFDPRDPRERQEHQLRQMMQYHEQQQQQQQHYNHHHQQQYPHHPFTSLYQNNNNNNTNNNSHNSSFGLSPYHHYSPFGMGVASPYSGSTSLPNGMLGVNNGQHGCPVSPSSMAEQQEVSPQHFLHQQPPPPHPHHPHLSYFHNNNNNNNIDEEKPENQIQEHLLYHQQLQDQKSSITTTTNNNNNSNNNDSTIGNKNNNKNIGNNNNKSRYKQATSSDENSVIFDDKISSTSSSLSLSSSSSLNSKSSPGRKAHAHTHALAQSPTSDHNNFCKSEDGGYPSPVSSCSLGGGGSSGGGARNHHQQPHLLQQHQQQQHPFQFIPISQNGGRMSAAAVGGGSGEIRYYGNGRLCDMGGGNGGSSSEYHDGQ